MIQLAENPRSRAARRAWADPTKRCAILSGQLLSAERRRVDRLVRDHLHLLDAAAGHFAKKFPSLDHGDLHSSALPGLLLAAEKFDPTHPSGASFGTVAWWWMRNAIQEALPELLAEHGIRLPRQAVAPRPATSSLDLEGRDGSPRVSRISDEGAHDPIALAIASEDAERIRAALGRLRHERDAQVIRLRFGLDGSPPMTLREVGDRLGGVTHERVRQLELRALNELRDLLGE